MRVARLLTAVAFATTGLLHFISPGGFEDIVPDGLPAPLALVYLSGLAELAGALGVLHPRTRAAAGVLLLATLAAVYPANIDMALHPDEHDVPGGRTALILRLPLQFVFAWVVWTATLSPAARADRS